MTQRDTIIFATRRPAYRSVNSRWCKGHCDSETCINISQWSLM